MSIRITGGQVAAGQIGSGAAPDGQVLTADGAGGAAWETPAGGGPGYLVYVAKLSQSGIDAPEVTVMQNTIGSITWTRTAVGVALANKGSPFSSAKTFVFASARWGDPFGPFPAMFESYDYDGSNNLTFLHFTSGSLADGYRTLVEIRIYP